MDSFRDGFRSGYDAGHQDARNRAAAQMRCQADRVERGSTDMAHEPGEPGHEAYVSELERRHAQVGATGAFATGGIVHSEARPDGAVAFHGQHFSGRLASVRRHMAEHNIPAGVDASRTVADSGPSLPQRYAVYTYALVKGDAVCTIYGADQQQGMSQDDANALRDRLVQGSFGLTVMVLPITPAPAHG